MSRVISPALAPDQVSPRPGQEPRPLATVAGFEDWYAASFDRAVRVLLARTGDREQAQDCVQEAYLRAWDRRHDLADLERPDDWVRVTAHRLAISGWRRAQVRRRTPDRAVGGRLVSAPPTEDRVALTTALRSIPRRQGEALVLFYVADLSVADVAARLGVPSGTVKSWLSRGRAALADVLLAGPADAALPPL